MCRRNQNKWIELVETFRNSRSICFDFRQQIDSIYFDKPQKIPFGMEPNTQNSFLASSIVRRDPNKKTKHVKSLESKKSQ